MIDRFLEHAKEIDVDCVAGERLARYGEALPAPFAQTPAKSLGFVKCGQALPGYEVEIRDPAGGPRPAPPRGGSDQRRARGR